jgi:hypothetical protein
MVRFRRMKKSKQMKLRQVNQIRKWVENHQLKMKSWNKSSKRKNLKGNTSSRRINMISNGMADSETENL